MSSRFLARLMIILMLGLPALALAGVIKVWASGDRLTSADLNANFAYIINHMVGGQGAKLVDADVSSTAAIAHSKLQYPKLLPKLWATVSACNCAAAADTVTCTYTGTGVLYIKSSGVANGQCKIYPSYTINNTNMAVFLTGADSSANMLGIFKSASAGAPGTGYIYTQTITANTGTAVDNKAFNVLVMDDDSGP